MEIISLKDEPRRKTLTKNHKCDNIDPSAGSAADYFRVTAIKPAVKNPNRANIFINDRYDFSLDLAQIVNFKLKVGQTLAPEQLDEYRHASEFGKLYQRTLEWVLMRPRSIKETRDHLIQKRKKRETENRQIERNLKHIKSETLEARTERKTREEKFGDRLRTKPLPLFSTADIDAVITKLTEKSYLNDYNFAKYYLENKNTKKGASLKKLRLELVKKGIDQSIIEELSAENLRSDEAEIQKIITKKRAKYDDRKLINYLLRQGFSYDLIRESLNQQKS